MSSSSGGRWGARDDRLGRPGAPANDLHALTGCNEQMRRAATGDENSLIRAAFELT